MKDGVCDKVVCEKHMTGKDEEERRTGTGNRTKTRIPHKDGGKNMKKLRRENAMEGAQKQWKI